MKILVTGATGFLGKSLCPQLETRCDDLVQLNSKNCDLTNPETLSHFDHIKFDFIYHLAAWTQAGDFCLTHQGEQWIINQKINTHVLSWWKEKQPQAKLICMGSSCAYDPTKPLKEKFYLNGVPLNSLFSYAMTKRMLYVGLIALNRQFGLNYLCIVPSTLYGPGYHTDGRQMHFIFDLIRKIIRGKLYDEPVVLWGDGYQRRELIHVDDFVNIMLRLVKKCENDIINIGSGKDMTIRSFAKLICEKAHYDFSKIQFDTTKYVGAKSKCLSIEKLHKIIPDISLIPLDIGLQATIEWFIKNKETIFNSNASD
ncbi:NAD-dependent epimerase/dehydratase family protein [Thermodesulfobacteriota bacterium]